MTRPANAARGEAQILLDGRPVRLRPTFNALVAAEEELGSLFAFVERAAEGQLKLSEMVTLFWHCRDGGDDMSRADFSVAIAEAGLVHVTPALKILIGQILGGR